MRRLQALGVVVQAHQAPRARAAQVRQQLGSPGEAVALQLDVLDRLRYGAAAGAGQSHAGWWREFRAAGKACSHRG